MDQTVIDVDSGHKENDRNLNIDDSDKYSINTSCNWLIVNNIRELKNVLSVGLSTESSTRLSLEDIVDEARCVEIKPKSTNSEACNIDIKINEGRKIQRIGVVSEASVLEIFRENGEYAFTVFAELIDEFEDSTVYYSEIKFDNPTSEVSLKFTRIKNNRTTMFLYGIKLIINESPSNYVPKQMDFNPLVHLIANSMRAQNKFGKKIHPNIVEHFLNCQDTPSNYNLADIPNANGNLNTELIKDKSCENDEGGYVKNERVTSHCNTDIMNFIDLKFKEMERRIFQKISLMEVNTEKKLDEIKRLLELRNHQNT